MCPNRTKIGQGMTYFCSLYTLFYRFLMWHGWCLRSWLFNPFNPMKSITTVTARDFSREELTSMRGRHNGYGITPDQIDAELARARLGSPILYATIETPGRTEYRYYLPATGKIVVVEEFYDTAI